MLVLGHDELNTSKIHDKIILWTLEKYNFNYFFHFSLLSLWVKKIKILVMEWGQIPHSNRNRLFYFIPTYRWHDLLSSFKAFGGVFLPSSEINKIHPRMGFTTISKGIDECQESEN